MVFFTNSIIDGTVDTLRTTIINKDQILDCETSKKNCELLIDRDGAISIAKKAGFTKKNPVYTLDIIFYGTEYIPTWHFITPFKRVKGEPQAQSMNINARTGEYKLYGVSITY